MKRIKIIIIALVGALSAQAQTQIHEGPLHSFDAPRKGWLLPGDTVYTDTTSYVYTGESVRTELLQDRPQVCSHLIYMIMGGDSTKGSMCR